MFRKLNPAMWDLQQVLTIGTFLFTLAVFIFFFVRALRMKKTEAEHMSQLPVSDENTAPHNHER